MVSATMIGAVLDAHDALVRDCSEGRLSFGEFLGAYGDFPRGYGLEEDAASAEERAALRLFRKRMAFHRQAAGILSGFRATATLGSLEDSAGVFLPAVGLMRLRDLVARHPRLEAPDDRGKVGVG
jgi:hypothetical protein